MGVVQWLCKAMETHGADPEEAAREPLFYFIFIFYDHVCVCMCVFYPFILDVKFVGCTSRGHTGGRLHIISYPPSFCGACLYFSREKDSAVPFPRRP